MEVTPTIQNLKTMSLEDRLEYPAPPTMAPAAISLADRIFKSNRASHSTQESGPSISRFDAMIPPLVPHMPTTSKRKTAKKPKKVVVASAGLPPVDMSCKRRESTPRIVEVPSDSDEVLDWGSSDEIAEVARTPGAIRVDNYYSEEDSRDGTGGIFDNDYDPRQVTISSQKTIHANLYQQYNSHVAYSSRHEISVDTSKINRNSLVNCVKCKKDKTVQFIADSGVLTPLLLIKMISSHLLKMMVQSKQLIKRRYYKYKDMVQSLSNMISISMVKCAPSLVNYNRFTMHLKYCTDYFQSEVYCRKDIA